MAYRRFRHTGKDKVTMDFAFFAIAFNIKKMCAKLAKEEYGLLCDLIYGLYRRLRTLYRLYSTMMNTPQQKNGYLVRKAYSKSNEKIYEGDVPVLTHPHGIELV